MAKELSLEAREVMKLRLGVAYEDLPRLSEAELDALYEKAADFEVEESAKEIETPMLEIAADIVDFLYEY
ncbi:MAG: hypothetical protein KHZ77_07480 [Veillonella sp.]|uniref:hypothetical protein n=1 Tax=Veillonella sp. TaxID=1926307 RepID=UPI0025F55524|nr:hypothetical protein [Veillonella sp.]MBS4913983.1 hypothetical protein [Veillonella sp.]